MAEPDPSKDTDVTNDDGHGDSSPSLLSGDFGSGTSYANPSFDSTKDSIPVVSQGDAIFKAVNNIGDGSEIAGSATDIGLQITDLAANTGLLLVDPIGFMVSAGLGFLIDLVQPLEDLLGMVTGNPERMGAENDKWGRVRSALEPLSEQVKKVGAETMPGWQGDAATIAKQRLSEFGDAIAAVGGQIAWLETVLELAKALAGVAQDVIKGLIGSFVSEAVITWAIATATATVSFGASIPAAVSRIIMAYAGKITHIMTVMERGSKIFQAIAKLLKGAKVQIQALGNAFAAIKTVPGLLGKAETKLTSSSMSDQQINNAMT